MKISQPRLRTAYMEYRASLPARLRDGVDSNSGKPNVIARTAAREKFSTEMIEVTVDAKQRLRALRSRCWGAVMSDRLGCTNKAVRGNVAKTAYVTGRSTCTTRCQYKDIDW